jgi:predicted metal-dependent hydrolase
MMLFWEGLEYIRDERRFGENSGLGIERLGVDLGLGLGLLVQVL